MYFVESVLKRLKIAFSHTDLEAFRSGASPKRAGRSQSKAHLSECVRDAACDAGHDAACDAGRDSGHDLSRDLS